MPRYAITITPKGRKAIRSTITARDHAAADKRATFLAAQQGTVHVTVRPA